MTGPQNPYTPPNGQPGPGHGGQPWGGQGGGQQWNQPANQGQWSGQPVYGQPGPNYQGNPNNPNQGRVPTFNSIAYYDENITDGKGKRLAMILAIILVTVGAVAASVYFVWNSRDSAEPTPVTTTAGGPTEGPTGGGQSGGDTPGGDTDEKPDDDFEMPRVADPDDYKQDGPEPVGPEDVVIPPFPDTVGPYQRSELYPIESTLQSYDRDDSPEAVLIHVHGAWTDFEKYMTGEPYGKWICNDAETAQCGLVDRDHNIHISISSYDMNVDELVAFSDAFYEAYMP